MEQSSWMAVDEDSEIVIHDRPVPPALSESGEGKTGRAKDLADLWWDINLSDVDGDNGNDNTAEGKKNGGLSGDLSPLTVAAPIRSRRASNPETLATAANTALAGHNNLSPLTVRAPDAPRRHSGDFDSKGSAKMGERAPWDLGGECFMLAREEADGGQGEGLGREGGREDGRVAFPVSSPPYGFDSETRAQLGESSEAHPHSRISSSGIVEMAVEPLNEECNFEGRPVQLDKPVDSPFAAAFLVPRGLEDQHLVFTGLEEGSGQSVQTMTARAQFFVGGLTVERVIGPLQAGPNGRIYGLVKYPSVQELWKEVYDTRAVRAMEVDVLVEVRSRFDDIQYLKSELKVMYRREETRVYDGALWRP